MSLPYEAVAELLHNALRSKRSAALNDGVDAEEVTADLTERVERMRELNARARASVPPYGRQQDPGDGTA